jgi:hypothetical protein
VWGEQPRRRGDNNVTVAKTTIREFLYNRKVSRRKV